MQTSDKKGNPAPGAEIPQPIITPQMAEEFKTLIAFAEPKTMFDMLSYLIWEEIVDKPHPFAPIGPKEKEQLYFLWHFLFKLQAANKASNG